MWVKDSPPTAHFIFSGYGIPAWAGVPPASAARTTASGIHFIQ